MTSALAPGVDGSEGWESGSRDMLSGPGGPGLDAGGGTEEARAVRRPARDDFEYAYFVAEIRVLETRLLTRTQLLRMVEAPDAEAAFRMLGETEYGRAAGAAEGVADYESALAAELGRVFGLIRRDCPEPELVGLLGIAYDFQNLKTALKAALTGKALEPRHLVSAGNLPPRALLALARGGSGAGSDAAGDLAEIPPPYMESVARVREMYHATQDPQDVDLILDAMRFRAVRGRAQDARYDLVERVTSASADLINMRTAVRMRLLGRSAASLLRTTVPGGAIPPERLAAAMAFEPAEMPAALAGLPHSDVLAAGMQSYAAAGSLVQLEKLMDDRLLSLTREARYVALGPDAVIAYFLAKETEIKNLRIIFTGKLNRLPEATIRERLRETYA
jgi:V/A-type H+-transporting ATPase subunit C